jgi:pimeloyl-ACP methyl ester carboxylesterase
VVRRFARYTPVCVIFVLAACVAGGDVSKPVPSAFYPAPETPERMVVMLPGIGDSLKDLEDRHVAAVIQRIWPHADVVLTGLTFAFYKQGHAAQRLQDDVIARYPRQSHDLWLAGISLGGMGALLYDRRYPDRAKGMLLLSPYLGEPDTMNEIRAAGGLARWNPGPRETLNKNNFSQQLWRYIKGLAKRPARANTMWLAYGSHDRMRHADNMLAPQLPPGHTIVLPGHHNWKLWLRSLPALLKRAKPGSETSP